MPPNKKRVDKTFGEMPKCHYFRTNLRKQAEQVRLIFNRLDTVESCISTSQ